jgi:hypothetical protein
MQEAGFVDVVERVFELPQNEWPETPAKEIGKWTMANFEYGLEGLSLRLFSRGLGWSDERTILFCTARSDLKNPEKHGCWRMLASGSLYHKDSLADVSTGKLFMAGSR